MHHSFIRYASISGSKHLHQVANIAMFADHQNKRLCDVIFPGSHDGAITEGKAHTQTQNYEIGKQAKYGCRWFDIRIMYTSNGEESEPVAFHAPGGKLFGPKTHNKGQSNEYQTLKFGGTGMKLEDICLLVQL